MTVATPGLRRERPRSRKVGASFLARPIELLNSATPQVTPITLNGAPPHWFPLHFHSYFFWVSDTVEGFISDVVVNVELLDSWQTLPTSLSLLVRMSGCRFW